MEYTNSYFTLDIDEDSVYMNFYPPLAGGETLKITEVTDILDKNKIVNYDLKEINELIKNGIEPKKIKISNSGAYQISESMALKITADGMYAIARFYPPSSKGDKLSEEEIYRDLEYHKIKFGINKAIIEKQIKSPEYFKNVVIAQGKKPVQGSDGVITYHFNRDRQGKPRLNQDGTVDFHHLDNIVSVVKDTVLATITPADKGIPGQNIYGNIIKPEKVEHVYFKYAKNIHISEDGLKLISDVDGHVTLEDDKVSVSNVFEVPSDVDASTGDIEFNGSVLIKGNVRTGFVVNATGNIEVLGVVEGAVLNSGEDIVLQRGVQGMNRCIITAGGNLISKFIESANVNVNGTVNAESIFNSKVAAKGDVVVSGKGGSIIGGDVRATSLVEAAVIGTAMGVATSVEVGIDPSVRDRIKEIDIMIKEKNAEIQKLSRLLELFTQKLSMGKLENEKIPMIAQFDAAIKQNKEEIENLMNESIQKEQDLSDNINARIKVVKDIHPGTKVTIAGDFVILQDKQTHCIFEKKDGEITSSVW